MQWLAIAAGGALALGCGSPPDSPAPAPPAPASAADPELPGTAGPAATITGDRMSGVLEEPATLTTPQPESSPFRFRDIAAESGIDFVHVSGMTAERRFPTANGSGVALFDYDNDGWLDIYFATQTQLPLGAARSGPNRLYKNLEGKAFKDVTAESGLGFAGFCHGIVVGDIDNDGDQDVFLCNYGPNVLFLNNGDGTFRDISQSAGVAQPNWTSGGAFLDYDNDGDADLYLANYGEWIYPRDDVFCGDAARRVRLYCTPRTIKTVKHILYRNNGDRTFTDVTDQAGIGRSDGHGFGVVAADLNGDGRTDLFVANDLNPNFLFLNKGDGTFDDATEASGAAFDEKGSAHAGMGVDAEDVDGDGLPDLIVTSFANEYNTFYQNLGKGSFMDATPYFGLASDTLPWVGWGTALADFDNDGWPDNFVTNGQIDDNRKQLGQNIAYAQPPLLFANRQGKRFHLATRDAGPYFDARHVGRGAAFGDVDNDGDLDIVVNHKDGPPALLRNDSRNDNHWIRLELRGTISQRDAVGARVAVTAGERTIYRLRKGGCSMESANDPRLLIGVGPAKRAAKVVVSWPSGRVSTLEDLETGRSYKVVEPGRESGPRP